MGLQHRWSGKFATAGAALLLAALPSATMAHADTDSTFSCDPGFYQVIAGQLAELSPGTGEYDEIGEDHDNYNAMGYRIADGYLYGMSGRQLLRIDATGERTVLATLDVRSGPYTGDFGDDGLLHVSRGGGDWYAVDVDTHVATRIPQLSVYKGVADITNVHGTFYGVSSDGILYAYDPAALTIRPAGQVDGLPITRKAYGAAWSTAGGNLYVGRNTGEIFQITGYSTDEPKATQVGDAPPTNSNDGASCSLAPVPAGLNDIDGPYPETEPSTPESKEATERYVADFEVHEDGFTEFVLEPEPVVDPTPVVVNDEPDLPTVDDAGIGRGAGCEPGGIYDRPERADGSLDRYANLSSPLTLFDSPFDADWIEGFTLLSGNWYMANGHFSQLNTCGFDYTALLNTYDVRNFRWEATFSAVSGANQGGLIINQSAEDTRSGAMVIDLANGGERLRVGAYDHLGYYVYIDSVAIDKPVTGQEVTLAVRVLETEVTVFLNGVEIIQTTTIHAGGMVGLIASESDIAFDSAKLVALPSGHGSGESPADPDLAEGDGAESTTTTEATTDPDSTTTTGDQ